MRVLLKQGWGCKTSFSFTRTCDQKYKVMMVRNQTGTGARRLLVFSCLDEVRGSGGERLESASRSFDIQQGGILGEWFQENCKSTRLAGGKLRQFKKSSSVASLVGLLGFNATRTRSVVHSCPTHKSGHSRSLTYMIVRSRTPTHKIFGTLVLPIALYSTFVL